MLLVNPPPAMAFATHESVDGGNVRIAVRRHTVCHNVDWLASDRRYPHEPRFSRSRDGWPD